MTKSNSSVASTQNCSSSMQSAGGFMSFSYENQNANNSTISGYIRPQRQQYWGFRTTGTLIDACALYFCTHLSGLERKDGTIWRSICIKGPLSWSSILHGGAFILSASRTHFPCTAILIHYVSWAFLREIHKVVGAPSPYVYLSHLHPHILKWHRRRRPLFLP